MLLAKPRALLPALLLLELALCTAETLGRPGGHRGTQEHKPWLLRVRRTLWAPSASRSSEILPTDLSLKDKFIKHLTGPVTFSAKCRKYFHRLYYNTRDCTTPAYYKRCARLLTRLAMNPLCSHT
ncbi:ALK and LTK ligand 1 [Erinaceus europaeus]|uniref:ALK and LTK ligand 1 n=1 Tax=Erinaceus europaeus TaxID=9365 RepID=A0A1S2Z9V8_ERIEU|nr:ALK and LTK ligand 1 [Erinaceus europaeus]